MAESSSGTPRCSLEREDLNAHTPIEPEPSKRSVTFNVNELK